MRPPACPNPDKTGYFTREMAEHKLHRIWASMVGQPRQRRDETPCRAYQCDCGMFHLTHKPLWEGQHQP